MLIVLTYKRDICSQNGRFIILKSLKEIRFMNSSELYDYGLSQHTSANNFYLIFLCKYEVI